MRIVRLFLVMVVFVTKHKTTFWSLLGEIFKKEEICFLISLQKILFHFVDMIMYTNKNGKEMSLCKQEWCCFWDNLQIWSPMKVKWWLPNMQVWVTTNCITRLLTIHIFYRYFIKANQVYNLDNKDTKLLSGLSMCQHQQAGNRQHLTGWYHGGGSLLASRTQINYKSGK